MADNIIEILRPGIQTTVQDLGRVGLRHLGVAQCGALDAPAMSLANRLVDNRSSAAGLELVAGTIEIRFHRAAWFALCGANFDATLDGQQVHCGWRSYTAAGQVLKLKGPKTGMRSYLAVDGGLLVPEVLGSRATDIQAGFGGWQGRSLLVGDCLPLGEAQFFERRVGVIQREWTPEIRALPGPEYSQFDETARRVFWSQPWTVSAQSNRMGYRLQGPILQRETSLDLASHGVLPGVIQVPPNGQPIVLLADAQTTGGYPRFAVVIEADLWKFAQAPPGRQFFFVKTDLVSARAAQAKWQQEQARFERSAYGK
jgi:biotin-dependent carboxylase-like uncharacterized protein